WPARGRRQLTVRFGEPLLPGEGESVRDFAPRVRAGVARLLDEDQTDWYAALRRAASGETPDPSGPDIARWRRVWASTVSPDIEPGKIRAWRRRAHPRLDA
ncbi:MAG: 1-acyl-sn-glycerol-3-phosphate acyltransferase, partial [Nocardioides sp.]